MTSSNVALARRGYEAIKRGDVSEVAELLDEDVKWHWGDPTAVGACRNRREALAFMQRPGRGQLGELVDMVDAGDRVVVIMQPPSATGEPAQLRGQITTFRDGKVVEMVGYPSVEAALEAAGVEWQR